MVKQYTDPSLGEVEIGWKELATSPVQESGSQSHTVSIPSSADMILVQVYAITNESGAGQDLEMTWAGQTGGYEYRLSNGTATTGAAQVVLAQNIADGRFFSGRLLLIGRTKNSNVSGGALGGVTSAPSVVNYGQTLSGAGELDQLTIRGSTGNIAVDCRVFTASKA